MFEYLRVTVTWQGFGKCKIEIRFHGPCPSGYRDNTYPSRLFAQLRRRSSHLYYLRPPMSELLADDPEWADVVPIRQYENVNPIAPIFYSEECPYGPSALASIR